MNRALLIVAVLAACEDAKPTVDNAVDKVKNNSVVKKVDEDKRTLTNLINALAEPLSQLTSTIQSAANPTCAPSVVVAMSSPDPTIEAARTMPGPSTVTVMGAVRLTTIVSTVTSPSSTRSPRS